MAVPSRAFVGILVFALIATLAVVPYTWMMVTGYEAPPETPYDAILPDDEASPGTKLALLLASAFCLALVVAAWRGLLHGARLDRRLREERARRAAEPKPVPRVEEQPPGYQ